MLDVALTGLQAWRAQHARFKGGPARQPPLLKVVPLGAPSPHFNDTYAALLWGSTNMRL